MFSSRLPPHLEPNALSRAAAALERSGTPVLDLTETNPTAVGIEYPSEVLRDLADARALRYEPQPFGLRQAREAVAADYARRGLTVSPDRIVLTASTSEAYSLLFKLLCDPADTVLVPQPSYPLFDLLTALDGVTPAPYRLDYSGVWTIDRASVERAVSSRTRALLVVSPNNPTGSMLRRDDREWLVRLCDDSAIAIIADEVFGDYPLAPRPDACAAAGENRVLTFSLGGLSKSAGLPQAKLGWMAVSGPDPLVTQALARLELMCDSYLSVSTPVQVAAASLIAAGATIRTAIAARLRRNLDALSRRLRMTPSMTLLDPEGGWSAVVQVPAVASEETLALRLLQDHHVRVHPGFFFDFAREAFLVVSLLPAPDVFDAAIDRMCLAVEQELA